MPEASIRREIIRPCLPLWVLLVLFTGSCRNPTAPMRVDPPTPAANPLAGCRMCHVDVEDEFVGSAHFDGNVGCTNCHGSSEGHLADENNEVKPDELFAREDVDRLCGACHACARRSEAGARPTLPPVCIDCHGPHSLALLKRDSTRAPN